MCMCMCAHKAAMATISSVLYMRSTREKRDNCSSSFFLFYSILPPNTRAHTLLLSSIRCENKNNCIFLVVQYLPINCSQINNPGARQLNATVTDGFDKHTRGTFEQCLIASKMEQEKRTRRIAIKRSQNKCDLW